MKADLHLHTWYSDGTESPRQIVERAARANLDLIAITDHDSLGSWDEASAAGKELGIRVLPAAEFTASWSGKEVHLLGYFPTQPGAVVRKHLEVVQAFRHERIVKAIEYLRAHGVSGTFEELPRADCCESLTGAHLARWLLAKGFARSLRSVWRRQAIRDSLQSFQVTVAEVIEVIHQGGGVAVWAHPGEKQFRRRLEEMVAQGLDGVEVRNFRRDPSTIEKIQAETQKYGLLTTGGSDWHEGPGFGENFVTEELLDGFLGRMGLLEVAPSAPPVNP